MSNDGILLDLHPSGRGPEGNPTISARETLRRILEYAKPSWEQGPTQRWVLVGQLTSHGSGYSTALCKALGLDPDEEVMPEPASEWVADALHLHPPEHGNDIREDRVGNCPHCRGVECEMCHDHSQRRGSCWQCPPVIRDEEG